MNTLLRSFKEYLIVGGMPAAVSAWAREKSTEAINQIHFDLLTTYRDDFAKYSGRLAIERLEDILNSVPRQLGKKFVYKNANSEVTGASLKQAFDLLCKARLCHRIVSTSACPLEHKLIKNFQKLPCSIVGYVEPH